METSRDVSGDGLGDNRQRAVLAGQDVTGVVAGLLVAFAVNVHGLVSLTVYPSIGPGQLNALLFATTFVVLLAARVLAWGATQRMTRATLITLLMAAGATVVVMLVVAGVGFPVRGNDVPKATRDVLAVAVVFLAGTLFRDSVILRWMNVRAFAGTLALVSGVLGTIAGALLFPLGAEGRLAGLVLTPTMLGNSTLMILVIAFNACMPNRWLIPFSIFAGGVIVATGTRVAFLLYLFFEAFVVIAALHKRSVAQQTVVLAILIGIAAIGAFMLATAPTQSIEEARVVSTRDAEGGSIATRLFWILLLLGDLQTAGPLGGFGAGAAERRIGLLPHFDVLRFWYDYSVLFVILAAALVWRVARGDAGPRRLERRGKVYIAFLVVSVILFTTHNVFQDLAATLLITIMLASFSLRYGRQGTRMEYAS